MALENLEVIVDHLESADIRIFERDKLELHNFPELSNGCDLLLHLSFVFGYLCVLLDLFFVSKQSQFPQKFQSQILINSEFSVHSSSNFIPMPLVLGDHWLVF